MTTAGGAFAPRSWPALALLLTVTRYRGQGHTVLPVRTSEGNMTLENLTR